MTSAGSLNKSRTKKEGLPEFHQGSFRKKNLLPLALSGISPSPGPRRDQLELLEKSTGCRESSLGPHSPIRRIPPGSISETSEDVAGDGNCSEWELHDSKTSFCFLPPLLCLAHGRCSGCLLDE
uniref:Uncharacterized protein n=1 Tax=Myotis myotis TaxID=51298 RepID=A0A7J7SC59_MYOMY|nr:hypothetical protein mMyoMyo1_009510 [Myotis myotis]